MKRRQALCGLAQFLVAYPPYHWGLSCFGQRGVSRVLELLRVELAVDMGRAGEPRFPTSIANGSEFGTEGINHA